MWSNFADVCQKVISPTKTSSLRKPRRDVGNFFSIISWCEIISRAPRYYRGVRDNYVGVRYILSRGPWYYPVFENTYFTFFSDFKKWHFTFFGIVNIVNNSVHCACYASKGVAGQRGSGHPHPRPQATCEISINPVIPFSGSRYLSHTTAVVFCLVVVKKYCPWLLEVVPLDSFWLRHCMPHLNPKWRRRRYQAARRGAAVDRRRTACCYCWSALHNIDRSGRWSTSALYASGTVVRFSGWRKWQELVHQLYM